MRQTCRVHVALLVRTMLRGGVARQVVYIALGLRERGHRVSIIQFFDRSHWDDELAAAGVDIHAIRIEGRADLLRLLRRSNGLLRSLRPEVLYGFYVESNLLALLLGRRTSARVIWGLRFDSLKPLESDPLGWAAASMHARLLRRPDLVIANSHIGGRAALAAGLPPDRLRVIVNGVDTARFRPHHEDRRRIRGQWNLPSDATVIGLVAKADPRKGHEHFVRAAAVYAEHHSNAHFVRVGPSDAAFRRRVDRLARELGIGERLIWAGVRKDMESVYNAFDLTTLLSDSEGSPNVVAESLACGIPCVVSNVGDSARVVGDPRAVITSPGDAQEVASAWEHRLADWGPEQAAATRQRLESEFGVAQMVDQTESALRGS
jgi:glycosyltransferase involved in cell wall biosynthesis